MLQSVLYNQGNNKPAIVALPALGERKEIYEAMAENLKEFCFLAVDLPGHNKDAGHDFSIEKYIQELKELLDQLSIEKAHFIGNSIGAWIIQSYYKFFSETVLSITLLDGGYYFIGDYDAGEVEKIELPVIKQIEDLKIAIEQQADSMDLSSRNKERFKIYLLDNFIQKDGVYIHHSDVNALQTLSRAITETNYCLQQDTEVPVLLLLADQEKENSEEEKIKSFLLLHKDATIKLIPNSYHLLAITNPLEVAAHFKNLVKSLSQKTALL